MLALTEQTGKLLARSVTEARRLAATARRKARGRGAQAKLRAAAKLDELADRCEKVATQIKQRVAGEKITDRLISLSDPDARPIRKGKLGKPNEFGYVAQIAEITPNTKRGARGLIVPAASQVGNPVENALLPQTVSELKRLGLSPKEVALDGGFTIGATSEQLEDLDPERVFIAGRQQPAPNAPNAAYSATAPAPKDASATSNAATACAAAASKAMTARRPGPDGASSPTTSTP